MNFNQVYSLVYEAESNFFEALLMYKKSRSLENLLKLNFKWLILNEYMGELLDDSKDFIQSGPDLHLYGELDAAYVRNYYANQSTTI